jgi:hypothetical protein
MLQQPTLAAHHHVGAHVQMRWHKPRQKEVPTHLAAAAKPKVQQEQLTQLLATVKIVMVIAW